MECKGFMVGIDALGWDAFGSCGSDERSDDGGADGDAFEWGAGWDMARRT